MATVTGLTAARMLAIEAASVVDGEINGSGHLILTKHDGSQIDAGSALVAAPNASDTVKGVVELATTAEVTAGTDTTRAVTPAGLKNGYVLPNASDTVKGVVELATISETSAGSDTTRVVTPSGLSPIVNGLDSRLDALEITAPALDTRIDALEVSVPALDTRIDTLEAEPGKRVVIIAPGTHSESTAVTSYPQGISMMSVSSAHSWSLNSSFGMVVTYQIDNSRAYQEFHAHQSIATWIRYYYQSDGWSAWTPIVHHIVTSRISITPTANVPTSITWNYGRTLPGTVRAFTTLDSTVPGSSVIETAVTSVGSTSCTVWVYRTNNVLTNIQVMAIGGLG